MDNKNDKHDKHRTIFAPDLATGIGLNRNGAGSFTDSALSQTWLSRRAALATSSSHLIVNTAAMLTNPMRCYTTPDAMVLYTNQGSLRSLSLPVKRAYSSSNASGTRKPQLMLPQGRNGSR
jgi:hypothetical protein